MLDLNRIKVETAQEILRLLQTCAEIDLLFPELRKYFEFISRQVPWIDSFMLTCEKTSQHIEFYYYDPETQSAEAIVLKQNSEFQFLFREEDHWNLNDEVRDNEEIAREILTWSALRDPQTVREVMDLIKNGFWRFDAQQIPKLSGEPPVDLREVISWDDKCVLTGTTIQNMDVITREEWQRIVAREHWYDEDGS